MGYREYGRQEELPDILHKLMKVFAPITVSRDVAEQERDIILREYDLRMAYNPDGKADEVMNTFLYAGNGVAASTIGTPDQIRAMQFDDAKAFHDATHRPEYARLVVSGDVSATELPRDLKAAGFPRLATAPIAPPAFTRAADDNMNLRYPDGSTAPRITWRKSGRASTCGAERREFTHEQCVWD